MRELGIIEDEKIESFFTQTDLRFYENLLGDTLLGDPEAENAVLIIHGFTGSNIENLYLANELAKCGFRVLTPLLPGHGTNYQDLENYGFEDWMLKVKESLSYLRAEKLDRHIFIIGHSLGGVLVLNEVLENTDVDGIVLLATPYRYPLHIRLFVRVMSGLPVTTPFGDYEFSDERLSQIPFTKYLEEAYQKVFMSSINEVFEAQERIYGRLGEIKIPSLLIYSHSDDTVPPSHGTDMFNALGSEDKELIWVENSNHILTIDCAKNIVANEIIEFINRVSGDLNLVHSVHPNQFCADC